LVFACSQADVSFGPENRAAEVSWSTIISILATGSGCISTYARPNTLDAARDPLCVGSFFDDLNRQVTIRERGQALKI